MLDSLTKGGRLCVITFHSLEDRIVKQFINSKLGRCTCPPNFPKCVCNAVKELKVIIPKIINHAEDYSVITELSKIKSFRKSLDTTKIKVLTLKIN